MCGVDDFEIGKVERLGSWVEEDEGLGNYKSDHMQ